MTLNTLFRHYGLHNKKYMVFNKQNEIVSRKSWYSLNNRDKRKKNEIVAKQFPVHSLTKSLFIVDNI